MLMTDDQSTYIIIYFLVIICEYLVCRFCYHFLSFALAFFSITFLSVLYEEFCSGFLQVRENWKKSENLCGHGKVRANIMFEKFGKLTLDHADCRYL